MIDIKKWLEKYILDGGDTSGNTADEDGSLVERLEQIQEAVNITLNALDKQQKSKDECSLSKEEIVGLMGLVVEYTPIITPQEDLVMQESVRQALIRLNMLDFSNIDLNDKQSLGIILKDILTILWIKYKD